MIERSQNISANNFLGGLRSADKSLIIGVRTVVEVDREYLDGRVNMPLHELSPSQVQAWLVESKAEGQPVYLLCGVGLIFAGIKDTCAMGMLLARMPWYGAVR